MPNSDTSKPVNPNEAAITSAGNIGPHAPETSHLPSDPVLKPRAAALYLGLTVDWLATMRGTDKGPAFIRVGPRSCVYRKSALDAWRATRVDIKGTTVAPTTLPDESLPTSLTPSRP